MSSRAQKYQNSFAAHAHYMCDNPTDSDSKVYSAMRNNKTLKLGMRKEDFYGKGGVGGANKGMRKMAALEARLNNSDMYDSSKERILADAAKYAARESERGSRYLPPLEDGEIRATLDDLEGSVFSRHPGPQGYVEFYPE